MKRFIRFVMLRPIFRFRLPEIKAFHQVQSDLVGLGGDGDKWAEGGIRP